MKCCLGVCGIGIPKSGKVDDMFVRAVLIVPKDTSETSSEGQELSRREEAVCDRGKVVGREFQGG